MKFVEFAGEAAEYQLALLKQIVDSTWQVFARKAEREKAAISQRQAANTPTVAPKAVKTKTIVLRPKLPKLPTSSPVPLTKKVAAGISSQNKATQPQQDARVTPLKSRTPVKPMKSLPPLRAGERPA